MKIIKRVVSQSIVLSLVGLAIIGLFFGCGSQGPRTYSADRDGWIGVYVQDLDGELRRYLDVDERYGVLINDVISDSPAEAAGMQDEDLIIQFDGKRIRDTDDLTRAVQRTRPDKKVDVEIIRDKQKKTVQLTVGERRARYSDNDRRRVTVIRGRPWLGIRMAEINEDLAQYFSVEKNAGVLILSVEERSPAEKADLKAGDVILELASRKVRDLEDVYNILSDYNRGDEVEIKIKRRGDTRTVKVELDRPPHSYHFDFDERDPRAWKEELRDELHQWKHNLKYNLNPNLHDLDARIRIQIDDEIRRNIEREIRNNLGIIRDHEIEFDKLGNDFGAEMEKLGRDLEREMENLAQELEKVENELQYERFRL